MSDPSGPGRRPTTDAAEAPTDPSEWQRLRADAEHHRRLRDMTVAFARDVSTSLSLNRALDTAAHDANGLLGGRRTSIWLYNRRARTLTLSASSDDGPPPAAGEVAADDSAAVPARGLRMDRPILVADGRTPVLAVPLRGWRRALGTLVVEGPFTGELGRHQLAELAHELSRQLSAAIENIQLLEEVLRQRRLLEDTFNSIVDLVVVTDIRLRAVQMNDAFIARVGLSRAEVLDRPLEQLVGDELSRWAAVPDGADGGAGPGEGARTRRLEDPRLGGIFSVTMTTLIGGHGEPAGHVLVARDITRQTRLENEREEMRARLAQSEKLASLGQFVAGIAHEMNNPLQGVLGHLELLMETTEAARPLRRELRRIYLEADRAAKIVRNLMVFTGSRRLTRRRLKLGRVLARAVAARNASLGRAAIEVVRDVPAELPPTSGDPMLLHQAFLNFLINAEHAIAVTGRPGRIEIHSALDATAARLKTTIRDTGPGIPEDALPRIFDPFFTTKEVGKGTGLGLAITYGIVQDHGGAIHAANGPDGGAVITIELPAEAS